MTHFFKKTTSHIRDKTEIQLPLALLQREQSIGGQKEKEVEVEEEEKGFTPTGRAHSLRLTNTLPQRYSIGLSSAS